MWLFMFIILLNISNVLSQPVKSLPGFPGKLPLKLETGYVGVGDVQLFYYFTESERSPKEDPLILWLAGGPGCSALSALVYEIGPFTFNYAKSRSRLLPRLELSPNSWTKVANIIFLDAPVGTGFSYSTTWKGYSSNDTLSSRQTYNFLRKWLIDHPKFRENQLFIGGDSYAGIVVPIIVQEIVNGNEIGRPPLMNLRGYLLGNPATDVHNYLNSRIKFAHRLSLISDEIYESTKRACNGEYVNIDANNTACVKNLEIVSECLDPIYRENILEPICHVYCPGPTPRKWNRSILEEHNIDFNVSLHELPEEWCRDQHYILSYLWANDKSVQKALHVREDTITQWVRCNKSLSYTKNIWSSVDYHKNLTKKNIRSLIYSGDHDLVVPFIATAAWIKSLNLSIEVAWRPWFVDGQVAGYTVDNENYNYWLTFATVKGGGHTAPEFKPKQCLAMVARWLAIYPL